MDDSARGASYRDLAGALGRDDALVVVVDDASFEIAVDCCDACPETPALVLLADRGEVTERQRARLRPGVTVEASRDPSDRVLHVAALPREPTLIVEHDARSRGAKPAFRFLFWSLAPGGRYIVHDNGAPSGFTYGGRGELSVREFLGWLDREDPEPQEGEPGGRRLLELKQARASTRHEAAATIVEKANSHVVKLRDWEADDVFAARWGDAWGQTLVRLPRYEFELTGAFKVWGAGPLTEDRRRIEVPERVLRRYEDVGLSWRLLLLKENLALPDAFRHRHQRTLNQMRLVNATPRMARPLLPPRRRTLAGAYFLLDTEYPGHFGHVMTEVMAMIWGYVEAKRRFPSIRPVVTLHPGRTALPEFQLLIFEAFGIGRDEIAYVAHDEQVRLERLLAATPLLESPFWIDPAITETWHTVGEHIASLTTGDDDRGLGAEKVFVSRRRGGKRDCLNTPEIEEYFRTLGFTVYFPEDHGFVHQVNTFRAARRIAGFGGSGMFGIVFNPSARVLVLASENYTANNEYLLAAANGNDLAYVWGPAQVAWRADGRWDGKAFRSDFTIPLRQHRRRIRRFLR